MFAECLKKLLKLPQIDETYARADVAARDRSVFETLAEELDLRLEVSEADRRRIPKEGPVIVVANHPMGGMDGILLGAFLESVRKDWKLLCHVWFDGRPKLTKHMILTDPHEGSSKEGRNKKAMKDCVRWVKRGGLLAVYPAGAVARLRWRKLAISDPPWRPGVVRLARMTRATIVPVHISGRNSWAFQLLAMIHPKLAVVLLPHELLNKRAKTVRLRVGRPIRFDRLPLTDNNAYVTSFLRRATYRLAKRDRSRHDNFPSSVPSERAAACDRPVSTYC